MPPKPKTNKDQIIKGALRFIRKYGYSAMTAKALAKELGCSTQPIFWYFSGMGELKNEVVKKALSMFYEYMLETKNYDEVYMNTGMNYIRFAQKERNLFQMLFMSDFTEHDMYNSDINLAFILKNIALSVNKDCKHAMSVYKYMWLYAHGIATMVATNTARFSDEELEKMLTDVYNGLCKELES